MTKHIAIIFEAADSYSDESWNRIAGTITDWTEVSDKDYDILTGQIPYEVQRQLRHRTFHVIERPLKEPEFVADTVAAILKSIEADKEKERKRVEAEKRKQAEQKAKREAKKAERAALAADAERKHLAALLAKHPDLLAELANGQG